MPTPTVINDISFERISSPLGNAGSPFDKALCSRDVIVSGWVKKINRLVRADIAPGLVLSDNFADEIKADCDAVFPGLGGFASGGGPLS